VPSPMTFPVDNLIMQKVSEGFLGDLLSVDMRVSTPAFIDRNAPLHWRHDRQLSGLNIMTMGIWYEATLRWTPGVSAVMARTRTFVPMRRGEDGLMKPATVPDHVEILGDLPGGAVLHFQVSSVLGLTNGPEFWLYGSEGTLRYEGSTKTLFGGRRGDKALTPLDNPPDTQYRWRVEEEFVGAIRGQEPVTRTNFADGVRYMAFTEAVQRSAAEGKLVPVLV
ncbi:MAG TPA: Gfo/Idh/MocA family oxidoreductase, partial [Dehalococcoidia bacterium]|nr:Gfo/Idh/MocA family oxidoreductase [Dehalococcoidia bacterium]